MRNVDICKKLSKVVTVVLMVIHIRTGWVKYWLVKSFCVALSAGLTVGCGQKLGSKLNTCGIKELDIKSWSTIGQEAPVYFIEHYQRVQAYLGDVCG